MFYWLIFSLSRYHMQTAQQYNQRELAVNNPPAAKDTTPVFSWQVKGCAEKAAAGNTKFPSSGEYHDDPDFPLPGDHGITTGGDSIIYSRFVRHGCCRKVKVSTNRQEKVITIIEYWTGSICKCMCSSAIRAVIQKLPPGDYRVFAIETGTNPLDDKPYTGRDTVMQQIVIVK